MLWGPTTQRFMAGVRQKKKIMAAQQTAEYTYVFTIPNKRTGTMNTHDLARSLRHSLFIAFLWDTVV